MSGLPAGKRDCLREPGAAALWLRTPEAIRGRCAMVLAAAERDGLAHFAYLPERLDAAAEYVIATMRERYPDGAVPCHSRWRHFMAGGRDRWGELSRELAGRQADEVARIRFDLVVVSVLLDAGAGDLWRYVEPASGRAFARSEGLAVASFDLFTQGLCSAREGEPLRADAQALVALDGAALARALQVRADNPLPGLAGRVELLRRLGEAVAARPDLFGEQGRIGHLFDALTAQARGGRLAARTILGALLDGLGPIWPGRIELGGVNLGDVGAHPAARADDLTDRLVPFHKLSQWLAYSLVEPLEEAGIEVSGLEELTGLAEYRNGGLFLDMGVLRAKHAAVMREAHATGSEVVVEWRALTVALLDRLAERVRARLGVSADELPLAQILEGGTWAAGRRIAAERRPGGAPPLRIISDGTVF